MYQLLSGSTVANAMYPDPPTGFASASVADLLRSLPRDTHHQAYPIMGDHGRVTALLTASAIRAVPQEHWEQLKVSDLAYPLDRVTVVRSDEPLMAAVQRIDGGDVRTGVVVDPTGRLVGTIDAEALFQAAEARRAHLHASGA